MCVRCITISPVAIKPENPFRTHGRIDYWSPGGLALRTFAKDIREDKKALAFHLGFLALATTKCFVDRLERARVYMRKHSSPFHARKPLFRSLF